jgi:iron only hydrogenase large subunit-like protein
MVIKSDLTLNFPLKGKYVVMLAPSFIVDFSYPNIILGLKKLGFDKVVEVTYGAKMINRDYHKILSSSKKLLISTTCPGIVETIKNSFPEYKSNLILVDSPMIAMAKVCKKVYPHHKIVFLSPCNFKKAEAKSSKFIDYTIDFKELSRIFLENKISLNSFKNKKATFDKFYNDYTKIYPLSGGLSKTARIKSILSKKEYICIDGINKVTSFLKKPNKNIRFLDCTFCNGGCIGGPLINSSAPIFFKKRKVIKYSKLAKKECMPKFHKGLIARSKGISFIKKGF